MLSKIPDLNFSGASDNQIELLHKFLELELLESAPLAWKLAPDYCPSETLGNQSCLDYHRIWQYLLVLGITTSLRTDSDFLVNNFRDCFRRTDHCRILVSGAADYGLLSHILWAAKLEDVRRPSVTVLDRCKTSLELNKWFAKRHGFIIKTIKKDVLGFVSEKTFDCICTHSFLGWFSPSDKSKLLRRWHDNLDDNGVVITTARLRHGTSPEICNKFDDKEIFELQESVYEAARHHRTAIDIGTTELIEAVYRYAKSKHRYTISTKEILAELFEQEGFNIISIAKGGETEPTANRPSGPIKGASNRVNIIAVRR